MLYDNEKIRTLMKARELSGNALAKLAGISGPSMHAILNGETKHVRHETIVAIANALGVPIQQISKAAPKGKRDVEAEAAAAFSQLNADNRSAILGMMIYLASQQKKK